MEYLLGVIALISLVINWLQYREKQRSKGFGIEKQLKLNEIAREDTKAKYKEKKTRTTGDIIKRNLAGGPVAQRLIKEVEDEEKRELDKLNIEKEHLLKLKSHRFP